MKVKITSDSTCDLSPELLEKYNIDLLPVTVTLGERDGKDMVDIHPEDIYSFVDETGVLPKTSAVNATDYRLFFSQEVAKGYSVVHFCLGSGFSSTCQNAYFAAKAFQNVYIVDSQNLSGGQGLLVLKGAEMAQQGYSADRIAEVCSEAVDKVEASFVVDSLDYLHKGGRCSGLSALGATLLKIKPCIEVKDGRMGPQQKYRGRIERALMQYVDARLSGRTDIDPHRIFVTHTRCASEVVDMVIARVKELVPGVEEVLDTTAGSTVTSHCGPNTLGVMFMRKE